jgi:hypothetical protein
LSAEIVGSRQRCPPTQQPYPATGRTPNGWFGSRPTRSCPNFFQAIDLCVPVTF